MSISERCDAFVTNHRKYIKESGLSSLATRKSIRFFRLRSSMTQKTLHLKEIAENRKPSASPRTKKVSICVHILSTTLKNLMSVEHKSLHRIRCYYAGQETI